jgi:hypothetical protein
MEEVERHSVSQILNPLAESIGELGEAPHPHTHGQVLALHVAG